MKFDRKKTGKDTDVCLLHHSRYHYHSSEYACGSDYTGEKCTED